jgi:hypothetical protein
MQINSQHCSTAGLDGFYDDIPDAVGVSQEMLCPELNKEMSSSEFQIIFLATVFFGPYRVVCFLPVSDLKPYKKHFSLSSRPEKEMIMNSGSRR